MPQLFTNTARALLAAGISDTDTSLTVEAAKADLFPTANTGTGSVPAATNWFKLTLQDTSGNVEIVYVRTRTAGSGVCSNVMRGQEGTTALAFSAGTVAGLRITADDAERSIAAAANSVQLTGNQTVEGTKTFSSQIVASGGVQGDVTGNAGTVTNGVYTTGDQTIGGTKTFSVRPVVGTAAEKTSDTSAASMAAVDQLRSLTTPTTAGTGTLVVEDRAAMVLATGTITVPASVFASKDVVNIYNNSAAAITVAQGAGLTLRLAGQTSTGDRTLAAYGLVTIVFVSATEAVISGAGVT